MKKAMICLALFLIAFAMTAVMNPSYAEGNKRFSEPSGMGWEIVEETPAPAERSPLIAEPFSARVALRVSADDAIKAQVESYLGREIRELKDVVVTIAKPDWIISVIAIKDETRGGHDIGFTLAVLIDRPFNNQAIIDTVQEQFGVLGTKLMKDLTTVHDFHVMTVGPDGLRDACSKIVSNFDSNHLNNDRVLYQTLRDIQERKTNQNHKQKEPLNKFEVDPNIGGKI